MSEELLQELLSEGASCTENDGIGACDVNGTCDLSCRTPSVSAGSAALSEDSEVDSEVDVSVSVKLDDRPSVDATLSLSLAAMSAA